MLAPILPSPIMPSCIEVPPREIEKENLKLRQSLFDRFREFREIALYVLAEVDAERPAIAIGKNGEIAARLGGLDDAKGEFLARDRNIGSIIAGELEKNAGVRTALVGLAGGVEKARAEAEAGGGFLGVAHLVADGLQGFLVGVVHLDVAEKCEVIAGADAAEMCAEHSG